ncbi:MAG: hypothetical protein M0008_12800 [Actinomycetota bacterium]|nr:hypothetical protein [Actinomycetota bacterium]
MMPAKAPQNVSVKQEEGNPVSGAPDATKGGEQEGHGPVVRSAGCRSLRLPVVGIRLPLPVSENLGFYVALGALAVADVIDWPVALVAGAAVVVASRARSKR